ncbi:MAG TPA: isoprenylcysteine carboxylmethyltransferase family protein [Candidatus Binatia bacterium]|jgi:protein-S-isoprenylcysteine O-methyltransferase Ste14|nr:isoprenylcysteine carboxylmethyltransferase family protein [Candidatus Binatia bacterium]
MFARLGVLAYGVACYAVFFATFLYAVGFVGGFGVSTTLDGAAVGSMAATLTVNLGLLALFAVQHSLMARPAFKRTWTRIVPEPMERSTYVLASSLALILLFALWCPMGGVVWDVTNPLGRGLLHAVFAAGWLTVLGSTFLIDHFDLFGLRQVWLYFRGLPYTYLPFRTPGPYQWVRHPLYVGWLLAFWATPTMTIAHLVFAVMTTAYILVAIRFEERDLEALHGVTYRRYRDRVPMLVPRPTRRAGTGVTLGART